MSAESIPTRNTSRNAPLISGSACILIIGTIITLLSIVFLVLVLTGVLKFENPRNKTNKSVQHQNNSEIYEEDKLCDKRVPAPVSYQQQTPLANQSLTLEQKVEYLQYKLNECQKNVKKKEEPVEKFEEITFKELESTVNPTKKK